MDKKKIYKKNFSLRIKSVDEEKYIIRGIFSTSDEDRHGEIIDQKGWNLEEFMKNPVILFGHDQFTPAVGKAIEITVNDAGELAGAIQFAVQEDKSGLSETLFNLYKNGFMRAFSVGFENHLTEFGQDSDVVTLKKNTLYEISCVNVPANGRALAYSKGINLEPLEKFEAEIKAKLMDEIEKEINISGESVEKLSESIVKNLQKEILSADRAKQIIKVETPSGRDGMYSVRDINKVVRQLLKKKQSLEKKQIQIKI